MDFAAVDLPALLIGTALAALITGTLLLAHRGDNHRRGWIAAGGLAVVLIAIGMVDILRESPRETHVAGTLLGAVLPILGVTGFIRATRRLRTWIRALLAFAVAFVLFFGGLVLGAAVVPRFLPA